MMLVPNLQQPQPATVPNLQQSPTCNSPQPATLPNLQQSPTECMKLDPNKKQYIVHYQNLQKYPAGDVRHQDPPNVIVLAEGLDDALHEHQPVGGFEAT